MNAVVWNPSDEPTETPPDKAQAGALASRGWPVGLGFALSVIAGAALTQLPVPATVVLVILGLVAVAAFAAGSALGRTSPRTTASSQNPGSAELATQVVPIWQRTVEAARTESERSISGLLESFANVSARLDSALGADAGIAAVEFGAADRMLEHHQPQIDRLTETTRVAVRLKDNMVQGVRDLDGVLTALLALAKDVQGIGRATHLLALNASVEASHAGAGGGFAVIAQEVRGLASQSREAGIQIGQKVADMQKRIDALQADCARHDTEEDEIVRSAGEQARQVVQAMLSDVAMFSQASRSLRESSVAVQAELEKISMNLQSQDRVTQMLNSATDDMARYSRWLAGEDDPAAAVPLQWLERLEASYTMEEMRTSHHGTVAVDKAPAVEFF